MAKSVAIQTPIHQDAFELDPASQATLRLINEVAWSFAILFGRGEGKQIPLVCDADGHLQMDDASGALAELLGQLTGDDTANSPLWRTNKSLAEINYGMSGNISNMVVKLTSSNDDLRLADYFDSVVAVEPLWCGEYSVAQILSNIYDLLTDVITNTSSFYVTQQA